MYQRIAETPRSQGDTVKKKGIRLGTITDSQLARGMELPASSAAIPPCDAHLIKLESTHGFCHNYSSFHNAVWAKPGATGIHVAGLNRSVKFIDTARWWFH
jgi:hypothetical protein